MIRPNSRAWLLVLLLWPLIGLVAGCEREHDQPLQPNTYNTVLNVYTDGATGCQYVGQRSSSAGIAPRIAADGKTHMGCGTAVKK
jgi:hypothetical protein